MKKNEWMKRILCVGAVGFLLAGCFPMGTNRPSSSNLGKDWAKELPPSSSFTEEGSIWSLKTCFNLYSDVKARNVGDIVTISIVESSKASKNATTKTGRDSGLEASWSGLFDSIAGNWSINGQKIGTSHKIDLANNFDGSGETTRSSSMTAYITARVIRVLPNGNLVIRGTRQVQVNRETQNIYLHGVIRPEDISSSNIILSTYVAEAVIELNGHGPVSDKQGPGWMMRIVDWVWPF
jgi:flagellar L-ring protein precursor FlgH